MTLLNRQFLAAWVSVSSDPEDYGQFKVLRLPTEEQPQGPVQVQNAFRTTDEVTENRTLFQNPSVTVRYGNLLTLPVADGLLYVEPIYIEQKDENAFPQLARVLVYFGGQVGFAPTLDEALNEVFGEGSGDGTTPPSTDDPQTSTPPSTTTPPPDTGGNGQSPELAQAAQDIADALSRLKEARASNDFAAEGQALADLDRAAQAYEAAQAAAGNGDSGGSTAPSTPPSGNGGG